MGPPLDEDSRGSQTGPAIIGVAACRSTLSRISPLGISAKPCVEACGGCAPTRSTVYQLHAPPHVLPDLVDQLSDSGRDRRCRAFRRRRATVVAAADAWIVVPGISVLQVPFGILDPEAASTTLPLARERFVETSGRGGIFGGGVLALADRDPGALAGDPKWEPVQALRQIAAQMPDSTISARVRFLRASRGRVSTVLDREHVGWTSSTKRASCSLNRRSDEPLLRARLESCAAAPSTRAKMNETERARRRRPGHRRGVGPMRRDGCDALGRTRRAGGHARRWSRRPRR